MENNNNNTNSNNKFEDEIAELNKIGKLEKKAWTPFRKLTELSTTKTYPIKKLLTTNGKYGLCIVAELEECKVNLPKQFQQILTEENLKLLNSKNNLKLQYLGLKDNKYAMIEFLF